MPSVRPRRRSVRRRRIPAQMRLPVGIPVRAAEIRPVRGMKLKTVSRLTLLFALVCLGAFLAGRPPAMSGDSQATIGTELQATQRTTLSAMLATQGTEEARTIN